MSRLGNRAIPLPKGVKLSSQAGLVLVEGPKGKLQKSLPSSIEIVVESDNVIFRRKDDSGQARADHGLVWSVVRNMIKGVSEGFQRTLISVGVGYRMNVQGSKVNLSLGFSHPVSYDLPQGVTAAVQDQTKLTLSAIDKELLGSVADKIRKIRPPEPYKGKGVRYEGEHIQLKEGKSAAGSK